MPTYFNDTDMEMLTLDDSDLDAFIERQMAGEKQERERGRTEPNNQR